ncbi:MAG: methyl-accepting chemotaxis protein [Lachnobacterium sp.]|nr:methyl-accepting chemotaxis protein [Lachnobacterium sp.]MCI7533147.1 methyl-accepting chemotaxis protein [Lachnobacterium sp.]
MRGKEFFQNRKIADKLSLVLKVIIVVLAVNNVLFAAMMIAFGHPVLLIIPIVGIIAILILGKMMLKALTENILEPLEQLETAAYAISQGNLEIDVTYESEDELGSLAQSFRRTSSTLKDVIGDINQLLTEFAKGNLDAKSNNIEIYSGDFNEILNKLKEVETGLSQTIYNVKESSDQVSAGADQLAERAQGLAEGATDQAAALEELTASVNEVASHVAENTESTDRVHDQAKEVAIKADHGTAKMKELIESMKHISDTTNDIQTVIEKIESIASQTNLLSLNASIEAARAGEAGRGFAVVAEQIKELAEESASSAEETRVMLTNSLNQVEIGSSVADETSQFMAEMIEQLDAVVMEVAKIRQVSDRQAESVKQISQAIEQVNGVVQENSATSEQVSATSQELSASAEGLDEMISGFKIHM